MAVKISFASTFIRTKTHSRKSRNNFQTIGQNSGKFIIIKFDSTIYSVLYCKCSQKHFLKRKKCFYLEFVFTICEVCLQIEI